MFLKRNDIMTLTAAAMILTEIIFVAPSTFAQEQSETVSVTVEKPQHGTIKLTPAVPSNGQMPLGTVITVKATPAPGYAVDSIYFYNPGEGMWRLYHESSLPELKINVERKKVIGASFIEQKALEGFMVRQDIVYAQPGAKKLKYDVYTPNGARNLPCVVIIHGGGWAANTEDIMRGLARELVRSGDYVVCSIDYRFIGTRDGDPKPNTMANLIEDVYGAIAHIQEHAQTYGADPTRLAVTGDSAGGHLSASAANLVSRIGTGGFGIKEGVYEYKPTYMPSGKTVSQVRREIASAIQVAAPSYGVFSGVMLKRFLGDQPDAAVKAVSPIDNIPNIKERNIPQYLLRGTNDMLIRHEPVQAYADALKAAGQTVRYVQVEGAGHAFFDWKPDAGTKATFAKYGIHYAAEMKSFFDVVFYPN
jgi:acetyl esterase/lipase